YLPSGDQMGVPSFLGSNVRRVRAFRCTSISHTSREPAGPTAAATRVPSGETAGTAYSAGSPSVPVEMPRSSNHDSDKCDDELERYASVPASDTAKSAYCTGEYTSISWAIGNGSPANSRRAGSNRCAINVVPLKNTRCPLR